MFTGVISLPHPSAPISNESKGLLDRLFCGRVAPLAAHFSRHGKLTKRDIADLRRLIEDLDKGE